MPSWKIKFTRTAAADMKKLDDAAARRITKYLFSNVLRAPNPRALGKALTGKYTGYWRYRVGDHRIICEIRDNVLWVVVVMIGRRDKVYKRPIPEHHILDNDESDQTDGSQP